MILPIKSLKYYFLNHNNVLRKANMYVEFSQMDLTEVNPIDHKNRYSSGASGFSRMLETAVSSCGNQFEPFVLLEDDVKQKRPFPKAIEIPDDADILYIGLSKWGMREENQGHIDIVCYDNINPDLIRVKNMLSSHGFVICSLRGLLVFQRCMTEAYIKGTSWDIYMAQIQPYYNMYALRNPLVYQCGERGGREECTNITFQHCEKRLPPVWLKKDLACIEMRL